MYAAIALVNAVIKCKWLRVHSKTQTTAPAIVAPTPCVSLPVPPPNRTTPKSMLWPAPGVLTNAQETYGWLMLFRRGRKCVAQGDCVGHGCKGERFHRGTVEVGPYNPRNRFNLERSWSCAQARISTLNVLLQCQSDINQP